MKILRDVATVHGGEIFSTVIDMQNLGLGPRSGLRTVRFGLSTYTKLMKEETVWEQVLLSANAFLETLSSKDLRTFGRFYAAAREVLATTKDASSTGASLSDLVVGLQKDVSLVEKLHHWVVTDSQIPIPELSYVNDRIGDSLTFLKDDYLALLSISVLAKLMFPIWGDVQDPRSIVGNPLVYERLCLETIEQLLEHDLLQVGYGKLQRRVAYVLDRARVALYPETASLVGTDPDRIVFSRLIVRRFVTIDLYVSHGNILVWAATCARQDFLSLSQTLLSSRPAAGAA